MRHIVHARVVIAAVACVLSTAVRCQAQSVADVQAWLDREVKTIVPHKALHGHVIRWHREYYYVPPAGELASMRERVKGKPEHPEQKVLAKFDRRLKQGPLRDPAAFYFIDDRHWRLVDDLAEVADTNPGHFIDSAQRGKDVWLAMPSSLVVGRLNDDAAPGTPHPAAQRGDAFFAMSVLISGPLELLATGDHGAITIDAGGGRWTMRAESSRPESGILAYEVRGRWDATTGSGIVEHARWHVTDELARVVPQVEYRYAPRSRVPGSDFHAYPRVVIVGKMSEDMDPEWAMVLDAIEPVARAEAQALLATPRTGGIDPVRGEWRFEITRQVGEPTPSLASEISRAGAGASWTRILGLALLIVIPCGAVTYWLWRRGRWTPS